MTVASTTGPQSTTGAQFASSPQTVTPTTEATPTPGISGNAPVAAGTATPAAHGAAGGGPTLPPPKYCNPQLIELAITALNDKTGTTQAKISATTTNALTKEEEQQNTQQQQALEKSNDKMQHAKKAGVFHKIFGWIATAVTVMVAVAMAAATGGAATPLSALLIASAVLAVGSKVVNSIPAAQQWTSNHPAFHWTMVGIRATLGIATGAAAYTSLAGTAADIGEAASSLDKVADDAGIEMTEVSQWAGDADKDAGAVKQDATTVATVAKDAKKAEDVEIEMTDLSGEGSAGSVAHPGATPKSPSSFLHKVIQARKVMTGADAATQAASAGSGEAQAIYQSGAGKAQGLATKITGELTGSQDQIQLWQQNLQQTVQAVEQTFTAAAAMMQEVNAAAVQNLQRRTLTV
jgi:hypothetical protein